MKTLMKYTAIASLVLASSTHANTAWVEGPLWRAPQATSFTLKLKGKDKLVSQCGLYKKVVFREDGSLTNTAQDANRLQEFRKLTFPVVLEVAQNSFKKSVVVSEESVESFPEKLPYYTQKEAITGFVPEEAKNISVRSEEGSYTEISAKLGLEIASVRITQSSNGVYSITFEDRDVACDLFEGRATVTVETPSYVVITDESVNKIRDFYDEKLLPELNEVLTSKSEQLTYKAARIGYRTGKILDDEFSTQAPGASEKQIRELMKSLFESKKLELTSFVFRSGEKLHLNLDPEAVGKNVQVKLEF